MSEQKTLMSREEAITLVKKMAQEDYAECALMSRRFAAELRAKCSDENWLEKAEHHEALAAEDEATAEALQLLLDENHKLNGFYDRIRELVDSYPERDVWDLTNGVIEAVQDFEEKPGSPRREDCPMDIWTKMLLTTLKGQLKKSAASARAEGLRGTTPIMVPMLVDHAEILVKMLAEELLRGREIALEPQEGGKPNG